MPTKEVVGQRLRQLRGSRTLAEVANALGVSAMAVSLWETGKRSPADAMKMRIAEYYKKSVTAIFFKE